MANVFDPTLPSVFRTNRPGGVPFGDPFSEQIKGFGAQTPPPASYEAEVRARIGPQVEQMRAQMRAGGTPAAAPAAPTVASANPSVGSKIAGGAKNLMKFLGGRLFGGAMLALTPSSISAEQGIVRDATTGRPYSRGVPIDPQLAQRAGITAGTELTPELLSAANAGSGVAAPSQQPVTQAELDMGERNYQVAAGFGARPTAPAVPVAVAQPRGPVVQRDAAGRVVRSGATYDENGNIVIDTSRVGQVAAEERAIMADAFPRAGGARPAPAAPASGIDPYFAPFEGLLNTAKELGAQRTANRAEREIAVATATEQAKGAARVAEKRAENAKPITIETLTGKGAVVGDLYLRADEKGNLKVTRVPAPAETLRPGLDPAVVKRDALAAIKADPAKRAQIIKLMQDNGYSVTGI